MAILGVLLAVATAFIVGTAIAGPVAGLVVAALVGLLFRWIAKQATTGLFRANLTVYGVARTRGLSHEDSLHQVVASRYPRNLAKQTEIAHHLQQFPASPPNPSSSSEERQMNDLRTLVWLIFINENGVPPNQQLVNKYTAELDRALVQFAQKYARRAV